MNFVLLLAFLLAGTQAFAQVSNEEFLKSKFDGGLSFEKLMLRNEVTLDLATKLASERGIRVERISLPASKGRSYAALVISTDGGSEQNQEAMRVSKSYHGLPLLFSPVDLSDGAEAYFMADGSHLGVPYDFLLSGQTSGRTNSSYQHELQHASTHLDLVNGKSPLWGGFMRVEDAVEKPAFVSRKNTEGYSRAASLDEILTTALSAQLETVELLKLQTELEPSEFRKQWGPGREKLASIHRALEAGIALSKQTSDVAGRALLALNNVTITSETLTIGKQTAAVVAAKFSIDAFGYGNGPGLKAIAGGTSFVLYSGTRPTQDELKLRLQTLIRKSAEAHARFQLALSKISKGLIHVDVVKSDIAALGVLASEPLNVLVEKPTKTSARICSDLFLF